MAYGNQPTDAREWPISSAYVRDDDFQAVAASPIKYADTKDNTSVAFATLDQVKLSTLNGQAYSVMYTQIIGPAATGQFALSVFNPSTSGKNVLITSVKTLVNYGNTTTWLYLNTSNPSYNTNITPINMKSGGPATALTAGNITTNSATVSFPGSGNFDMSVSSPEVLHNNASIFLPNGANNGFVALVFAGNNQSYAIVVKWIEFA